LALTCAFATNLGFLYKYRGAKAAATVDMRHPLRSAGALFGSKWFAIGMGVAVAAWVFHVAALAMAPMSVVQAVLSGGVVLLAAASGILFGVSDIALKAMTGLVGSMGMLGFLTPWTLVAIAASIGAFYASARGLQIGQAVPVIATTSTAANVAGIAGGIVVFG